MIQRFMIEADAQLRQEVNELRAANEEMAGKLAVLHKYVSDKQEKKLIFENFFKECPLLQSNSKFLAKHLM